MNDTQRFLDALCGTAPPALCALLWRAPSRRSHFYPVHAAERIAVDAVRLGALHDVYIGCGLRDRDHGPYARGSARDVVAILSVWADLDLIKPGAAKPYFRDRATLSAFLDALPLRPTLRVWTGGGEHAWWLFKKPWCFADAADRAEAAQLVERWQRMLMRRAQPFGATIDSTFDLARVLRVPGTLNHKYDVTVELVDADGPRYDPNDFTPFLAPSSAFASPLATSTAPIADSLRLDPDGQPPPEKLRALLHNDLKFRLSWLRQRVDLGDQSPSAYDQSLASLAVFAGWTDQEVVDLLIAHRRQHGALPKLRLDYFLRTLKRARTVSVTAPSPSGDADTLRRQVITAPAAQILQALCATVPQE